MRSFSIRKFLVTALFVLAVAVRPAASPAEAVKDLPRPTDYVSDFANVLSTETKQEISRLREQLERAGGKPAAE